MREIKGYVHLKMGRLEFDWTSIREWCERMCSFCLQTKYVIILKSTIWTCLSNYLLLYSKYRLVILLVSLEVYSEIASNYSLLSVYSRSLIRFSCVLMVFIFMLISACQLNTYAFLPTQVSFTEGQQSKRWSGEI